MKNFIFLFWCVCTGLLTNAQSNTINFSKDNKPGSSVNSFTSAEFIYGRADLGGKTVKDFFKIPDTKDYMSLFFVCEVYKGDELIGDNNWNIMLVKAGDEKKTTLELDVLPDPVKARTVMSGTPVFDAGLAAGPLYTLIQKQYFKESGTYTIKIRVYNRINDVYGNEQPWEKWPTVSGSFTFNFNENDAANLLKNADAADATAAKQIKR